MHGDAAVIITIDGPAGTGKSSVAHMLARRLGLEFLDTGAMYRAAAYAALQRRLDPADGPALAAAVEAEPISFDWSADPPRVLLGGRDVSQDIRALAVSDIVSVVAAQPELRAVLVEQQRRIGAAHRRLVTEGRDQGTVVFPDAPLKFFLHADVSVRTERRVRQLAAAGVRVDHARVRADIERRDMLDASRSSGPLRRPDDAVDVDTGDLSLAGVVSALESIVRERLGSGGVFA